MEGVGLSRQWVVAGARPGTIIEGYMVDDLAELWDAAIYKEIASEAAYLAAQHLTDGVGRAVDARC